MKKIFLPLLLCFTITAYAQSNESAFISGSFGATAGGGQSSYAQRNAPSVVFSTGFGMPLFNKVFLYTRLSYISKSDYRAIEENSFVSSDISTENNLVTANASFSQLVFNGGFQYNIYLSDELTLGLNGGVTYALVNHKASMPNGALIQRLDNEGIFGAFTGASLEKRFEDSNMSLFGEAQYNYARKDVIYFRDKFSGMNFTVGGRYYFNGGN